MGKKSSSKPKGYRDLKLQRRFGGKRYTLMMVYPRSKKKAKSHAASIRSHGASARIVKSSQGYAVYVG